jgi:hypothetical protein
MGVDSPLGLVRAVGQRGTVAKRESELRMHSGVGRSLRGGVDGSICVTSWMSDGEQKTASWAIRTRSIEDSAGRHGAVLVVYRWQVATKGRRQQ